VDKWVGREKGAYGKERETKGMQMVLRDRPLFFFFIVPKSPSEVKVDVYQGHADGLKEEIHATAYLIVVLSFRTPDSRLFAHELQFPKVPTRHSVLVAAPHLPVVAACISGVSHIKQTM
jgi:hypothetical protein